MKAMRFPAVILLLALSLPVFADTPPASAVKDTGHHLLWKVEGKSNVVYLLGSFHLLAEQDSALAPAIESAFTNARIAVFEADIDRMMSPETLMKLTTQGTLPEGQTLQTELSLTTYTALTNCIVQQGLPPEMLDAYKPGVAAMMLEALSWLKLGVDVNNGMDKRLF